MPGGVTLDLREGFDADDVAIRAAGTAEIRRAALSTRLQTGLAASLTLPAATQAFEIELTRRGLVERIVLRPERPLWVGVSLSRDGRQLEVRQQGEPFGYV